MTKCEKHNIGYVVRQMEHGKTMYICTKCEKERIDKFKKLFGGQAIIETPNFPQFYG